MKRVLILGLFLCLVMLSFKKEEIKEEQPLTNAEKIARDVQKEFGAFDAVYYHDDSLGVVYTYRPEANKTRKLKGVIDKTLNMVGEEMIPNFLNPEYNYKWETPTETISMQGVYKDSNSYVNVWVLTK
ncbi:MAG TPA: hypothetical protein VK658_04515 [Chryseolinea sp.]|nr:hypothetical protein [Chryseolinea sp.]